MHEEPYNMSPRPLSVPMKLRRQKGKEKFSYWGKKNYGEDGNGGKGVKVLSLSSLSLHKVKNGATTSRDRRGWL